MPSPAPRSVAHDHRSAETGAYTVGVAVVRGPARRGWWRRVPVRLFGGAGRMLGVDVARGLAVLGLLCGALTPGGWAHSLAALVTAALFLLLAGVSASLMLRSAAGAASADGLRVAVRAVVLFAAGAVAAAAAVSATGTPPVSATDPGSDSALAVAATAATTVASPAVMLPVVGALTIGALFLRRWRARTLFIVASACVVVLPSATVLLRLWMLDSPTPHTDAPAASLGPALAALLTSTAFPPLTWTAPFLVGLAVGRLRRDRIWRPFALLAAGGALFAIALASAALVERVLPQPSSASSPAAVARTLLGSSFGDQLAPGTFAPPTAPVTQHATLLDVLGATAIALSVLALCLLLAKPLRWLVFPIAALGSTALTASALLFATILFAPRSFALLHRALEVLLPPALDPWLPLLAAGVVWAALGAAASVWRALLGRGPLERVVAGVGGWAVASSGGAGEVGGTAEAGGGERASAVGMSAPTGVGGDRVAAGEVEPLEPTDHPQQAYPADPAHPTRSIDPAYPAGMVAPTAAAEGIPAATHAAEPAAPPRDAAPEEFSAILTDTAADGAGMPAPAGDTAPIGTPPTGPVEPTTEPPERTPHDAEPWNGWTHRETRLRKKGEAAPRRSNFGQPPVAEASVGDLRVEQLHGAAGPDGQPTGSAGPAAGGADVAAGADGGGAGESRGPGAELPGGETSDAAPTPARRTTTPQWSPGQSLGRLPY